MNSVFIHEIEVPTEVEHDLELNVIENISPLTIEENDDFLPVNDNVQLHNHYDHPNVDVLNPISDERIVILNN